MQKQNTKHTQKTQTQTKWKYIFIGGLVIFGFGYILSVILTKEESSVPNVSVIVRNEAIHAPVSVISSEMRNPDSSRTSKELPPCNLVNPFSGSTDCKKEEKPKFQKPNTEWKTRTLSGIIYVFGEGNPREVQPKIDELKTQCKNLTISEELGKKGFCNGELDTSGSLKNGAEQVISKALADKNWEILYNQCEKNLRYGNNTDKLYPYEFSFDSVFYSGLLDINNFIVIDTQTGVKYLNVENVVQLVHFLERGKREYGRGESIINPYGDCVDIYAENIINNLWKSYELYYQL